VRRVRVLIDAANCRPTQGGVRSYTSQLSLALGRRPELHVAIATSVPDLFPDSLEVIEISSATQQFERRMVWREVSLPGIADRWRADVLVAPVPEVPRRSVGRPVVAVVHDVGPLMLPREYGWMRWLRYKLGLRQLAAGADVVVCVSQSTRRDLLSVFPRLADRAVVIGEAPQPLPAATAPEVNDLLYVGSLLPHKNIEVILEALSIMRGPKLCLVGPATVHELRLLEARADKLGVRHLVRHEGFASLQRLADLYAGATAVVLPTLYEGFGLTAAEALRAGAVVIASDIPAIREVCGDLPIYVREPRETAGWVSAINPLFGAAPATERSSGPDPFSNWDEVAESFSNLLIDVAQVHRVSDAA
jgi:glycosyltransferase involved in cell wall biosynthesis